MKKIDIYIIKVVLKQLFSTLFMLVGMIWLLKTINFLDFLINKNASVVDFLKISVFVLPDLMLLLIPLAVFAGAYGGLKKMVLDSEMDAIYAAGISRSSVMAPLLTVAVIFVGVLYFNSIYAIPQSRQSFYDLKVKLSQDVSLFSIDPGVFTPVSKTITVYVEDIEDNKWLKNILVFDNSKVETPVTWTADEGVLRIGNNNKPTLILLNGTRQEVGIEGQTAILEFKSHQIDLTPKVEKSVVHTRRKKTSEMFLPELFVERLAGTEKQQNKTMAELTKRILWPLAPLTMVLIPLYFLFTPIKRRFGIGRPSVYSIIMATIFIALQLVFNSQITAGYSVFVAVAIALEFLTPCVLIFLLVKEGRKN